MYDIIIETSKSMPQALKALVKEINKKTDEGWSLRGDYHIETQDGKCVVSHAITYE